VLVKPGDNVKKNDPLITLESDKSSVEVPSTEEGVIENINVKIGDKVSKGDLILSLNSQNGETKTKIPPVTEKIIEEAEKTLTKDKINDTKHSIQDILIPQKQVAPKKENRIIVTDNNDIDPLETKEWIDSLNAVVNNVGNERAHYLLRQLIDESYRKGSRIPFIQNTPYINTIPPEEEEKSPGDQNIERKIRSLIRWNAAAMVVRANKKFPELGGHIGTFASAATLYDVGMNHFWRAKNHQFGGDLIYFQGHSAPGVYARAFLEVELQKNS